jgi:hypothetical protein
MSNNRTVLQSGSLLISNPAFSLSSVHWMVFAIGIVAVPDYEFDTYFCCISRVI